MFADSRRQDGDPEIMEMRRILSKVLVRKRPTPVELEFLHRLNVDVLGQFTGTGQTAAGADGNSAA
jgi:hypothetical protein